MAIYELKPPVVDAIQWTGDNVDEILSCGFQFKYITQSNRSWIEFDSGAPGWPRKMTVGDYVIYDSRTNMVSVMNKEIFEAQYKLRESGN